MTSTKQWWHNRWCFIRLSSHLKRCLQMLHWKCLTPVRTRRCLSKWDFNRNAFPQLSNSHRNRLCPRSHSDVVLDSFLGVSSLRWRRRRDDLESVSEDLPFSFRRCGVSFSFSAVVTWLNKWFRTKSTFVGLPSSFTGSCCWRSNARRCNSSRCLDSICRLFFHFRVLLFDFDSCADNQKKSGIPLSLREIEANRMFHLLQMSWKENCRMRTKTSIHNFYGIHK